MQFTYDTDVEKAIELIRETGDSIREDPFLKYNLQGPLDVFGVDKMDLNGVVLTARLGVQDRPQGSTANRLTIGGGVRGGHLGVDYAYQGYEIVGGAAHRVGA